MNITAKLKAVVNILVTSCERGDYNSLASSDKGSDNQGHSFEDKVVEAFTTVFAFTELELTAREKRLQYNTTAKATIHTSFDDEGIPITLIRLPKGVDLTFIYKDIHLPIELKSANADCPKFNAGLNDGDRVRDEVIIFHSRKSQYIQIVAGNDLLPKQASDAFDEIEKRIRQVMADASIEFATQIDGFKLEYPQRQELTSKAELFKPNHTIFSSGVDYMCKRFE